MPVGAIMGVASVGGAVLSSNAARNQTRAQQQTTDTNNALQQQIFNTQRNDLAPWRQSGTAALAEINRRLGLTGPNGTNPATSQAGVLTGGNGGQGLNVNRQRLLEQDLSLAGNGMPVANALSAPRFDLSENPDAPQAIPVGGGGDVDVVGDGGPVTPVQPTNPNVLNPTVGGVKAGTNVLDPLINGGVPGVTPTTPTTTPTTTPNPNVLSDPENRYGGFYASPGYQFRMDEGNRAITGNRAASGMLQSGDTLRALTRYGQDYASNEYNTQLNQLFSVAGLGQTATGQGNAAASNYAGAVSQNNQANSNALQSSYGTQANAWGNALGQLGGYAAYRWG